MANQVTETEKRNPAQLAAARDKMDVSVFSDGAASFLPKSMNEVAELAQMMAKSDLALPEFLRNKPGTCLSVAMRAFRWGLDPFAVADKCYSVNNRIAYEAQLIAAVINVRAPLKNRPECQYEGEGPTLKCIVTATFIGEDIVREARSPTMNQIKVKNSPLWTSAPEQQLWYYTMRLWARKWCPELLLGVYSVDEFEPDKRGPNNATDITPEPPKREDYTPLEYVLWDFTGVEVETYTDPSEYLEAICISLTEMSDLGNLEGFNNVWGSNETDIGNLSKSDIETLNTFYLDLKPKEEAEPQDNAPDENQDEQPESPTEDEKPSQEAENEVDEQPATEESPAMEFHVLGLEGEDDIRKNIKSWHDTHVTRISGMRSKEDLEKYTACNRAEFSRLDADYHNEVNLVIKKIDEKKAKLK